MSAQEAQEAQRKAAADLRVPIEKSLHKSGIVIRLIPAGHFVMGSPMSEVERSVNEQPHVVTITNAFYIGKYEVTQGQWMKVMGYNPSCFTNLGDSAPVDMVSWEECTNFMEKLALIEGVPEGTFRLPTEEEWEYACRAGTQTAFCYGNDLDSSMANFNGRAPYGNGRRGVYRQTTLRVGQFKPNAWGLYDMHGNVYEWCANTLYNYKDRKEGAMPMLRVLRGGYWDVCADFLRSAQRTNTSIDYRFDGSGFRLCMPIRLAGTSRPRKTL